ncbi:IclR family transcriptional regulator [Salinicola rhizosphaerae]|uniref:HTH-type transcriptional repressor AllR n=1 Tax=Salinicola rhizosphaerae TaxID=1443141 RepID=A0ABQ3DYZ9_9GAMM|nr:IclR family transcriptional regulator [Salinicola rhizosphaerae]GHB17177.1 transcriptional regulator [Salinicola rhizosphaerae]
MDKVFLKGLTLLETMALKEEPAGVTELAEELNLNKSNVHRLLQALMHHDFVYQESASGRYACTFKLWQLGSRIWSRTDIKPIARPYLMKLHNETLETVHLSVRQGTDVVYIDKLDCAYAVGTFTTLGGRAPMHCVATGKAILMALDESELETLPLPFTRHTDKSLTTLAMLRADLVKARKQGVASNRGEWNEGVGGIAAPIFDASNTVCAAIGLSGPLSRLTPAQLRKHTPLVIQAARDISRDLGASTAGA